MIYLRHISGRVSEVVEYLHADNASPEVFPEVLAEVFPEVFPEFFPQVPELLPLLQIIVRGSGPLDPWTP